MKLVSKCFCPEQEVFFPKWNLLQNMSRLKCNIDEAYFVMFCLCVYLFVVCFVFCFCKISKLQFNILK